uniref:Reverse transcriptase domain-containing protein n=1 Tax=Megaselia scalaris TaxID=36166 RepID=T1GTJ8_MEGSC
MPGQWNLIITCPFLKKEDRSELKYYRGISLLNVAYKILASLISEKLRSYVISIVGPYHCDYPAPTTEMR